MHYEMPEEFFDCVLRDPVVIELCNKSSAKLLNIDLHLFIQQLHGEVVLRRFRMPDQNTELWDQIVFACLYRYRIAVLKVC